MIPLRLRAARNPAASAAFRAYRGIIHCAGINRFPGLPLPSLRWGRYILRITSPQGSWHVEQEAPLVQYLQRIWQLRYFWLALVRGDLRKRYRRSVIGLGWSLLQPLAMTTVLCVVFSSLFQMEIREFCPFLMTGLVTWGFFTAAMSLGCHCILHGESYIRQMPAPLAIYALRTVLTAGFHFIVGLVVAIGLTWVLKGFGNTAALLALPPALVLIFLTAWALAIGMGILNVLFQDTQHLIEVGLQILFYITPIIYPAKTLADRGLNWLVDLNPFAAFMELIRAPVLEGTLPSGKTFAIAAAATLVAVMAAAGLLARMERKVIFYL